MSFNEITHPLTNQKLSIFSTAGKNLLKNYVKMYKYGGELQFTDLKNIPKQETSFDTKEVEVEHNPREVEYIPKQETSFDTKEVEVEHNPREVEYIPKQEPSFNLTDVPKREREEKLEK